MPISPAVTPNYGRTARIIDGERMARDIRAEHGQIARLARCHVNTVGPALRGERKQYGKAHDVFTALNALSSNFFPREEHVVVCDHDEDIFDHTLSQTWVFPNAAAAAKTARLNIKRVAELSDVHELHVREVLEVRRPVARNLVDRIFDVLASNGAQLVRASELIR